MTNRELVEQSLADLRDQVDRHQEFVRTVVAGATPTGATGCVWTDCHHRRRMCTVLIDAIRVLEETRKAFKSKQLESLRRDFVRVLEDEMQHR
jgi:hypothetical protein